MNKTNVEGMKQKPAGGANRPPMDKKLMPTNISLVSKLGSMLSAIKHGGKPQSGGKMPFC